MEKIIKYPRTRHLESSRLQKGDEDLTQVRFSEIAGKRIVIEEKMDGANAGVSFDEAGKLHLQSRGHFLVGGPRERHWDMFKRWATYHESKLLDVLEDRYIMYGEWMYAKHTVYYDLLPHYFLEFDVYDKKEEKFLSTAARRILLKSSPVRSVFVLYEGIISDLDELKAYVTRSYFKTGNWKNNLAKTAESVDVDAMIALSQTDRTDDMEGLYIKVESEKHVIDRLKWVRNSFSNAIADSETHWLDRTIVPNKLAPGVDIFDI